MVYDSLLPSPPLREFVRNYTLIHFTFGQQEMAPAKQRSPKAEQKIVFYLKGSVRLTYATQRPGNPPPVAVFSNQMDRRTLHLTSEFKAFIIFFRPGVLYRVLRIPMPELHPAFMDAELYFGSEIRFVWEQLANAGNVDAMISIVERFLFSKLNQLERKNAVDLVAAHLLNDPTSLSLDAMADQACLSTKQFYRKFLQQTGVTPKMFARLSRFNQAYQLKLRRPDMSWSAIAMELCYTDYHHLEKEFRQLVGSTPNEWVNTELSAPERVLKLR